MLLTDSCSSKFERIERKMVKYQNSTAHDRSKWNWSKSVWKIKFFTNLAIDSIRQQLLLFGAFRSLLKLYEVYTCNRNNVLYRYISWLNEFLFVFFSFFALLNVKRVVCGISLLRNSLTKLLCVRFVFITGKRSGYSHEYNSHVYVCLCVCTLKRSWCTAQKLNWIGYSKMEHTHTHKHAKLCFSFWWKQHRAE